MKADERKKAILECAKKLFSRQGYYQTHIGHIIKDAKIARGTVYQYFDNKDDIFITLLEGYFTGWQNHVYDAPATTDTNDISPKRYFQERIRQTFSFLAEDPDLCNIALRMGLGMPEKVLMLADQFSNKIVTLITEDLKIGQQFMAVRDTLNVETTAVVLTGALFRTALHYFVKKRKKRGYSEKEIKQIADEFTDIFLPGLLTPKDNPTVGSDEVMLVRRKGGG